MRCAVRRENKIFKKLVKFRVTKISILTRIKSWIKFAIPRLAKTNNRVTGPGIPSVYPSPPMVAVSSPEIGALAFSSVCCVPTLPENSYKKIIIFITICN